MTEETTATYAPVHCCVKHPSAGGRCGEPFAVKVHGLNFCERHGEEARLGALLEEQHEVETFFGRFDNPHTRELSSPVQKALQAALAYTRPASDKDHAEALARAYPNPPINVCRMVIRWERDEEPMEELPGFDCLLDSLFTVHRLQRIAHQEGETWLVEVLESERQHVAAQAAVAFMRMERRRTAGRRL